MRWRGRDGVEWLEAELPGAQVRFTSRIGGVSEGPFDSMNLGILTDDERSAVLENRRLLADALDIDGALVRMARQVHGVEIETHDGPGPPNHFLAPAGPPPDGDGHLTSVPNLPMLVLVADCLPVALRGPGGLAILHCGWRGLAGGIVERAASRIGATDAVVGPGIGPCCFEVGDEVAAEFDHLGGGLRQGRNLDLWLASRRILERAGVGRTEVAELCTHCDRERFFSHRRDGGITGRQAGIAWID